MTAVVEEEETVEVSSSAPAWKSRLLFARFIKALTFVVPVLASIAWTFLGVQLLPEPTTALGQVAWWMLVLGGAIAAAVFAERLARRLIPLSVLLRLAMVFPETAPSRIRLGLKHNSIRKLKSQIEGDIHEPDATPQQAAETLMSLAATLSAHDRLTRGHSERVRSLSRLIGEQMDLPEEDLDLLQWAALLHDIGKLDVDPGILGKPDRLTTFEWESMSRHPHAANRYLEPLSDWLGEWVKVASEHHERWDGEGYPQELKGTDISLGARIVAVADAFDVMTSVRSYKRARPVEEALAEIHEMSGSQFDPQVVRALFEISASELRPASRGFAILGGLAGAFPFLDLRTVAIGGATAAAVAVAGLNSFTPTVNARPASLAFTDSTPTEVEVAEDETLEVELSTNRPRSEFAIDSVDGPGNAVIDDSTLLIEPNPDESGTVTVIVTACDQQGCDSTTIVAEVIARNDPPLANLDEAEVAGGEERIIIPVLLNDSDVDDPDLQITEADIDEGDGVVRIISNATELEFQPAPTSFGPWTITYVVTDGVGGFDQGTVTILDGNLEPQLADDEADAVIGETVRIAVLDNDVDDGGRDALRITEVSEPADGSVQFGDTWIDFVADADPGEVSFTYVASDAKGRESTALVTVEIAAPSIELLDDTASTSEDTPIRVDVLANDGPPTASLDPQTLTVISASSGTVSVGGGQITYDPPENAAGEASIRYEVCSAFGECGEATLIVTVDAVRDAVGVFSADGEIRLPDNAGPQLVPWLAVSSGENTPPAGTTFQITNDNPGLFSTAPSISSAGALTFEPQPGSSGRANVNIVATDPVNGARVFRIRVFVT